MPLATRALLKGMMPGSRVTVQRVTESAWDMGAVPQMLKAAGLFQEASALPAALTARLAAPMENAACLSAFAGAVPLCVCFHRELRSE